MWIEKLTGSFEDKRRYRETKARMAALPAGYRAAAKALEHYVTNFGPTDDGSLYVRMLGDLTELLERGAADGTPLRDVVGEDPVDFVEAFIASYDGASWVTRERDMLRRKVEAAVEKGQQR